MNKQTFLSILFLLTVYAFPLRAQQINAEMAQSYANCFYGNQTKTSTRATGASDNLRLVYTGGNQQAPDYYIYNIGKNEGFVIISGDQRMRTILAYSLEGQFEASTMPNEFRSMLKEYSVQADLIRNTTIPQAIKATASPQITPLAEITRMTPLLDIEGIKYDQQNPYNLYCPLIQGQHALTGCGATAVAQVMRYHKYPEHGQGSHKNKGFANDSLIDFSKATYNWDKMLPTYTNDKPGTEAQQGAIALLMHHVGVSLDMVYTLTGSGSSIIPAASSLPKYFLYNKYINTAHHLTYSSEEWFELIKNELDNERPVLYDGVSSTGGGHFFVCDGYDSEGRLHYNYGWNGQYNAYAFPAASNENKDAALCRYPFDNTALIGVSPKEMGTRAQIAQLSGINLSKLAPNTGTKFNASIRVSNYGIRKFSSMMKFCLFQGDREVKVLKDPKQYTVDPNNIMAGPDNIRTQNIEFEDLVIPANTANGNYQLRCMVMGEDSKYYPILGKNGEVQRWVNVNIANKKVTFTYPLDEGLQGELTVSKKLDINVSNGIGTARFTLTNPGTYNNTSKVYITGFKNDMPNMEVFGTETINLLPGESKEIEIHGMRLNSGKYTYFVAFNPVNPEGTWLGAVPLTPSNMSSCTLEVPAEREDYNKNLKALTALPEGYLQYKDDVLYTVKEKDDLMAPWRYYMKAAQANSFFNPPVPELGTSHVLATEALTVTDKNEVLEWTMSTAPSAFPAHYEVFVSTTGQTIKDLENAEKIYESAVEYSSSCQGETPRLSLFKYAGQKVYVFFRHTMDEGKSSTMSLYSIRLLNIQSPRDIATNGISIPTRQVIGETLPIELTVSNRSPFPILKFTATYTVGKQTYTEEIDTNLPYDTPTTFTLTKAIVEGEPGEKVPVNVTVSMEEEAEGLQDNNTASSSYTVMHFMPVRHMIVMKTARGGCGACSASFTSLDEMEEQYPANFNGGMELWQPYTGQPSYPDYGCDEFKAFYSGSTPTLYMNNQGVYFQTTGDIVANTANKLNTTNPVSEVKVEAAYADADSRTLNIKISSKFALPLTGKYKLGAYIMESNTPVPNYSIHGGTPSGNKRTKNHMPIGTVGGAKGAQGFVIENPKEGEEYVYTCQFDVPETRGDENRTRTVNRDNIQVLGIVFTPNGNIDNSAINSYYVRIPQTEGLSFVAEPGYDAFKDVNEVSAGKNNNFISVVKSRATVTRGSDFRFRIQKDASIAKKKLKVLVNLVGNRGEEVELPRDADGAYTLKEVNQFYFLDVIVLDEEEEEEKPLTQSFSVTDAQGNEFTNGQEITIKEFSKDEYDEVSMRFDFAVNASKAIALTLRRDDSAALPETINDFCLGSTCESGSQITMQLAEGQSVDGHTTYSPGQVDGTSRIVYTFSSSIREEDPLSVTVNFAFDNKGGVSIQPADEESSPLVFQLPGCRQLNIRPSSPCRITITDVTGKTLQQFVSSEGKEVQSDVLAQGYYVVTVLDENGKMYTQKALVR